LVAGCASENEERQALKQKSLHQLMQALQKANPDYAG